MAHCHFASNQFAVGFWMRANGVPANDQTIFAATQTADPFAPGVLVQLQDTGHIHYLYRPVMGGSGGTNLSSTTVVADGEWHYITVVRERVDNFSTNNVTLYVDGVLEATAADNTGLIDPTMVSIGR